MQNYNETTGDASDWGKMNSREGLLRIIRIIVAGTDGKPPIDAWGAALVNLLGRVPDSALPRMQDRIVLWANSVYLDDEPVEYCYDCGESYRNGSGCLWTSPDSYLYWSCDGCMPEE